MPSSSPGVKAATPLPNSPTVSSRASISARSAKRLGIGLPSAPRWVGANEVANPAAPPHGAELLQQERPVTTDARGEFVYPSHSYMTLLREARWWSLELSFQAAGYSITRTNFTMTSINTNLPDGTPVVAAGEIFLNPSSK